MGDKCIMITGASSGIGRACALRFAELGYLTFAGVRRDVDGTALRAEFPDRIIPVSLDVAVPESIAQAAATVGDRALTALINNAGIATLGPVELLTVARLRRQFEVNVMGLVAVTQAFLPLLRRTPGRIVNVGSIAGRSPLPGSGAYDSSKAAVDTITDVLRMELHASRISVSLIEAGAVATPIWEKSLREADALGREAAPNLLAEYAGILKAVRNDIEQSSRKAVSVDAVVRAVVHAVRARRPKTRYLVGWDTYFWLMLNWLPARWRDRLILTKAQQANTGKKC
jgi:NAD(P)-dependent dehydrogenase (short-subunit alcohol dehydrogenase family)